MNKTFLLAVSFLLACGNPVKEITPQLRSGVGELSKEISSEITFRELLVHGKMDISTGERTSKNLEITLTDAQIRSLIAASDNGPAIKLFNQTISNAMIEILGLK